MTSRSLKTLDQKLALIDKLRLGGAVVPGAIVPRPAPRSPVPASFGQQRLWMLERLNAGAPTYHISVALLIDQVLAPDTLQRSIAFLIGRHEALRTTFALMDGELLQQIQEPFILSLDVFDLTGHPEETRHAHAKRLGECQAREPFDLAKGPLLRTALVRLAPAKHVLVLTLHHIVADGWSVHVLLDELAAVYDALAASRSPKLRELRIQYADFAVWQRARLSHSALERDVAYWRNELKDAPRLNLPGDRLRSAGRPEHGAREFFRVDGETLRGLGAIAQQCSATLFMVLLAAFDVLLYRYSGQDDIVVGSPVAGRDRAETEGVVGFFLNTVCLRVRIGGRPSFRSLLVRVRDVALGAYAHQETPFEKIVQALAPEREGREAHLFDVMFVLQVAPPRARGGARVAADRPKDLEWQLETATAKFELTLSIVADEDGLIGALEYDTYRFEAATIKRMASHFMTLLCGAVATPEAVIDELPLLSPAEVDAQLRTWQGAALPFPRETTVDRLIAAAAVRSPSARAIVFDGATTSFSELDAHSNRLARYLRACNAQPGDRIGVLLRRTPDLVVCLLAVWKSGCAYVPFDPDNPLHRTEFIARDATITLLVTAAQFREQLSSMPCRSVYVDAERADIARESSEPLPSSHGPEHAAYILYTSGSTGQPKGVVVEHRSVVNYLAWVDAVLFRTAPRTIPAMSKVTFDASLKQLFAPLIAGFPVWLVAEDVTNSPARLLRELQTQGRFTLNCVPWLWRILLDALAGESGTAPLPIDALLLGGEDLDDQLIERTFIAFPQLELWNLYGPTEATANATAARILPGGRVSIGGPIANTYAVVLDESGRLLPAGFPGELHIGGEGLARGYWQRPDLTAERFVEALRSPVGVRLYKTGDRARYRPDGSLEYLGRNDRQVKIRGLRIELAEIETVLKGHPEVRDCAIEASRSRREPTLVAFIECGSPDAVSADTLRRFLVARMPSSMVPSRFVVLERLPRNAHGKIDWPALRAMAETGRETHDDIAADRDEQRVIEIWVTLLGNSRIGSRSNFFELGGHSLLAIQAISRLRDAFGVEIPLRVFFGEPTPQGIARAIRAQALHGLTPLSPIPRVDRSSRRT